MTIPVDTVVRGEPGSVHVLTESPIPVDQVGNQCSVHATALNQKSVHPNTDLLVTSGGSTVTVADVEREGGAITQGDGMLTLGTNAKIEVRLGADGVFSGGFLVSLCQEVITCVNPAIAIGVEPPDQEVVLGGAASFGVTVTNTGDEPFASVIVESNVAACSHSSGDPLGIGQQTSYTCAAEGVAADFGLDLDAVGQGEDRTCAATASASAAVTVQEVCNSNPALTIAVVPGNQDVPAGGEADFVVTVANSGDEDLENVAVDSSVAACDHGIGDLVIGAETSYGCTAEGVDGDLNVSFAATGQGVTQGELCSASDTVTATVGNPTTPPTTTPATTMAPATSMAPRTPTGVPTGTGDTDAPLVPVAALAVLAIGTLGVAAGSRQIARKRR